MKPRRASFVIVLASVTACEDDKVSENPPAPEPPSTSSTAHRPPHENPPGPRPKPPRNPPAPTLSEGDPAPDVTLKLQDGEEVSLAELKDELVFVYFYPKDDTPGCTVEAQGLRDHHDALTEAGVKVFGVSLQNAASHKAFIDKHDLPFPLVVGDAALATAFDVPVEEEEYAARHSFLIHGGKIVKVWRDVDPEAHAEQVLEAAKKVTP